MFNPVGFIVNNITMYRLMLYYLIALVVIAFILSFFHLLSFTPLALFLSTTFLIISCWIANQLLSKFFNVPTNVESVYISALILSLILTPVTGTENLIILGFISVFTIASKYIININRKHIFNPVAFGIWFVGIFLAMHASWWIGTGIMLPWVLIGGYLIVKKIQKEDLIFSFIFTVFVVVIGFSILNGHTDIPLIIRKTVLETPLFFFAFVMLTEPLTMPPTKQLQKYYGILAGIFFSPQFHVFSIYFAPEEALLITNIFSYLVSPKIKLLLTIKEKFQISSDIFEFVFHSPRNFSFLPGQYMEWTLSHKNSDSRGNRRYLTIASSPTEDTIRIGVRFNENPSSFKKALASINPQNTIIASQVAGDFVLPKDMYKKFAFLAGGIGITPFRSIIKFLIDNQEKRDIIILYSAKNPRDFAYKEVFDQAAKELNIKVVYTITDPTSIPLNWNGRTGRITQKVIAEEVPDYKERLFYFSGPQTMIKSFESELRSMGIPNKHMKRDFFPGFA